jgi:1-acyl-sn-glycerol-3-phosphate acyltransferase
MIPYADRPWWKNLYHVIFYHLANTLAWTFTSLFVKLRVTGRQNLPHDRPYLLVCNHISHFDPPLVAGAVRRKTAWIVALDMYAHPAGRFFFHGIDAISVDRQASDRQAVKLALERLKCGQPVGLYPEGGIRSGRDSIIEGQPVDASVAGLAQLGRVDVIPAIVLGTDKLYVTKNWWWRTTVDIAFGPPLTLIATEGERPAATRRAFCESIGRAMRSLTNDLRHYHNLTPADFPKTAHERWTENQ